MKLLLVEDDSRIAPSLVEALTDQHYAVDWAEDGQQGWNLIEVYSYDLIILDWMLPQIDGISLCQRLRQAGHTTPILLLTAKDTSLDKVKGLDVGADDYVVKPFDLIELFARIRALLRRGQTTQKPRLEWGSLSLNPATCEAKYREVPLNLTPKEYSLLELFLRNGDRVLSRNTILHHLWASDDPPGAETVKVHLRSLRQKLKSLGAADDLIETIYGQGYRLKPFT